MPRTPDEKAKLDTARDELIAMTAGFCEAHLSQEYAELTEKMVRALARKRDAPILRGARKNWAASIVHAIAQLNFLFDRGRDVHTTPTEIATYFGANKDTIISKAQAIRKLLGARRFGETYSDARNRASGERLAALSTYGTTLVVIQRLEDLLDDEDDDA